MPIAQEAKTMDVAGVRALAGVAGVRVVDVRPPFDYFGGRVPGSNNLRSDLLVARLGEIAPDTRLVLVCDDGAESVQAAREAIAAGYTDVTVMQGGLDAWLEAGLPIETIDDGVGSREKF